MNYTKIYKDMVELYSIKVDELLGKAVDLARKAELQAAWNQWRAGLPSNRRPPNVALH